VTTTDLDEFRAPRPRRADGARNFDAILDAARTEILANGRDVPLETVAERAGVGIATLYRSFPTRDQLVQHLYVEEIEQIVADSAEVADLDPAVALTTWIRRFVAHLDTKLSIAGAIEPSSPLFASCSAAIMGAAEPVLDRARRAGAIRADLADADLTTAIYGIATMPVWDDGQRERILTLFLDGVVRPAGA
jgi:AcrR family transcriptional regulator